MTSGLGQKLSRRELLRGSLVAGGALLVGFDKIRWREPVQSREMEPFQGGKKLGLVEFTEEVNVPMGKAFGAELDGRMYTDLSALTPENPITPTEMFYIRTRASEVLDTRKPWAVQVGGHVERPFALGVAELERMARPMGVHLMECAGEGRVVHFGMMSVADWIGAPLPEILENAKAKPEASRVLISGFDRYTTKSINSVPGASWIFTPDELKSARAFLATGMNGGALPRDHGAPVRLVVPGWYGCTCIKWVNEITLVDNSAAATSQMQEYASRTMQTGVPESARDYQPAVIDQAAMPIRIEKWLVAEKIKYRAVGILWGGSSLVKALEIRFNPEEDYVPVDYFQQIANDPWSFWSHAWTPRETGTYIIRLRVKEPPVVTRRLDSGYYVRTVEITEI